MVIAATPVVKAGRDDTFCRSHWNDDDDGDDSGDDSDDGCGDDLLVALSLVSLALSSIL